MKVVLRCQNKDALRSALWEPATSQNLAGSKPPKSPRSVFRQGLIGVLMPVSCLRTLMSGLMVVSFLMRLLVLRLLGLGSTLRYV